MGKTSFACTTACTHTRKTLVLIKRKMLIKRTILIWIGWLLWLQHFVLTGTTIWYNYWTWYEICIMWVCFLYVLYCIYTMNNEQLYIFTCMLSINVIIRPFIHSETDKRHQYWADYPQDIPPIPPEVGEMAVRAAVYSKSIDTPACKKCHNLTYV